MSCCPDISDFFTGFSEVSYENDHNVDILAGKLFRNGGVVGTSDAFADTTDWVDGTGCAAWVWTIHNSDYPPDDYESNLVNYFIYPEDGSTGVDGWGFSNQFVSFRRGEFLNSVGGGLIYYRNTNLGYNHFAIKYDNGSVFLYETSDSATTDPGWILPQSYSRIGLPTTTRYRLRVTVKNSAVDCHSSVVTQYIGAQSPCGQAGWPFGPLGWRATGTVGSIPSRNASTQRFDAGVGSQYYLIPQLSDSGNELRSKIVKDPYIIGKTTNASIRGYRFDVGQQIDIPAMEDGERLLGASRALLVPDSTQVAQSPMRKMTLKNASMHTMRIEGDDRGEETRDRIDQITYQIAEQGVRR